MAQFYRNLLKSEIRESSDKKITTRILADLDFKEVLANRWLWLADPNDRSIGEVYVNFSNEGDCDIEARSMNSAARFGNSYINVNADLDRLLMIVELLNI